MSFRQSSRETFEEGSIVTPTGVKSIKEDLQSKINNYQQIMRKTYGNKMNQNQSSTL